MPNNLQGLVPTIFAQGLKALRSNCVMPSLVNSDFGTEVKEKGDTIQVPVPSMVPVQDVVPGPVAPDPQGISPGKVSIPLNNWKEAPFYLTEKELAQIVDGVVPIQLSGAIESLATTINASILNCYKGVYGFVGTPGTTPFAADLSASTQARKVLGIQKAPTQNRRIVLSPDGEANALGLPQFTNAMAAADDGVIREGIIGRKLGFDWAMDQQIPTHNAGSITGTVTVSGAQAVANGSMDGGATGVITLATAAGAAINLVQGDILTYAGDKQTYVVLAPVSAGGSSTVTVNTAPALRVPKNGGEVVQVAAPHVVNLAFHRDAFAFASRQLGNQSLTKEADDTFQVADPVSGLTLRLSYREEFHRTRLAFDSLWGVGLVRPELGVRIAG
ncbi:P22 phage major capsid protein family protein [Chromobacterium subtsugae]|uniref:P22 phage major capsid protein family protein n=1 Tax=Chromobacterium subtsugae TaxID=251747 RepID=UPI0007F8F9D6|nr:P22 phage major capsid protein family protein [Chromobacterium subtsugae]OBU85486.1 hypothetical protein MY55_16035 [Chromobacterium subtsugae]